MRKFVALGMVVLVLGTASLALANKEDDAIKYTKILKTSKDAKAKIEALVELGNIGQIKKSYVKDAVPMMVDLLKDKDAKLRAAAAEALGKVDPSQDTKAVEALTEMAKSDKDTAVRISAMRGLGAMGPAARSALPALNEIRTKEKQGTPLYQNAMNATRSINGRR